MGKLMRKLVLEKIIDKRLIDGSELGSLISPIEQSGDEASHMEEIRKSLDTLKDEGYIKQDYAHLTDNPSELEWCQIPYRLAR
jgi:hypothetical protein|tara:strand:+ start:268 stop:516 length:249 start_codon:yes stop_codon:yes gene_type:complete